MSDWGQTEKSGRAAGKSALPSGTDIVYWTCQVRFVPEAASSTGFRKRLIRSHDQRGLGKTPEW